MIPSGPHRQATGPAARIAPAQGPDADAVAALQARALPELWSPRSVGDLLALPLSFGFVARADPEDPRGGASMAGDPVIGVVLAWLVAGEAEVLSFAVDPLHRGRGIGGALLDRLIDAAAETGAARLTLDVRESNREALRLYRSRGFASAGRRAAYYRPAFGQTRRETALILARALAPTGGRGG